MPERGLVRTAMPDQPSPPVRVLLQRGRHGPAPADHIRNSCAALRSSAAGQARAQPGERGHPRRLTGAVKATEEYDDRVALLNGETPAGYDAVPVTAPSGMEATRFQVMVFS